MAAWDKTQVSAFSLGSNDDLQETHEALDRTTVFHLFGELTAVAEYAVTDEDVLEFLDALQFRITRPDRLFDAMTRQSLMVVGCSFDDRLNPFFLRFLFRKQSRERLIILRGKTDFLCESPLETNFKIFLSYAREDKNQAKKIAVALESKNWSVFWDPVILPGEEWPEVLERAVKDADCVIVAWSKTSIKSRWVRAEAEAGIKHSVLIPIMFDAVDPPFGFGHKHATNMVGWNGDASNEAFQQLISAVTKVIGVPSNQIANVKASSKNDFLSSRTKVFPMTSIEFVNELHRRWLELHLSTQNSDYGEMQCGAVFISYSSEDQPAAALIRDGLEQAGIDVWFDSRKPDDILTGDNFDAKIKDNIDQCSLFIPIISQNTLIEKPRFLKTEWNYAQELADRYPDNKRFIIPVAIDDTQANETTIPKKFRKLHWERLQGGKIHAAFVSEIKELYRDYLQQSQK